MLAAFILAAVVSVPDKVYVFTQTGCVPCDRMKLMVSHGDAEVSVAYINCDAFIPEGVTAFPTIVDDATKRTTTGTLTLQQLKDWLRKPLATDDAAHTPIAEVGRVIALLPKPEIAFVDYGCGYDARWCIAAAEHWKCKAIGVEIDPARARAARTRVRELGLSHLVTIIEGDATTVNVDADVGVVYLFPDVLGKLRPRLERLRAFASYLHQVPGMPTTKNGDSWLYVRQTSAPTAVWAGYTYRNPVCNNPNCAMCNSIRSQLATQQQSKGHYETRVMAVKVCNGRKCWYENRSVSVWVP